jgi:uncharacterized glyoxalase superfamily protein PhnB
VCQQSADRNPKENRRFATQSDDQLVQSLEDHDAPRPSSLYVIVDDADAHYTCTVAAGAEIIMELEDADYGGRGYTCRNTSMHSRSHKKDCDDGVARLESH